MTWQNYTHKPTKISATVWREGRDFLAGMLHISQRMVSKPVLPRHDIVGIECAALIEGQAGYHMVKSGDYICRGEAGELFPVPPEIFLYNYTRDPNQRRQPFDEAGAEAGIADQVNQAVEGKA